MPGLGKPQLTSVVREEKTFTCLSINKELENA